MFTPAVRPRGEAGGPGVGTGTEPRVCLSHILRLAGGAGPGQCLEPRGPRRAGPVRSAAPPRARPDRQLRSRGPHTEELGRRLPPGQLLLVLPLALSPSVPRRIPARQSPTQHDQGHPSGSLRPSGAHYRAGSLCPASPGSRKKAQGRRGTCVPGAGSETAGAKRQRPRHAGEGAAVPRQLMPLRRLPRPGCLPGAPGLRLPLRAQSRRKAD